MSIQWLDPKRSLVAVSNSILKRFNQPQFNDSLIDLDTILAQHKKVVFILLDGLGKSIIDLNVNKRKSIFTHNDIIGITSVYPPTTVAATNAFLSGRFPSETGWLGWTQYFAEDNRALNVFQNYDPWDNRQILGENIMSKRYGYQNVFSIVKANCPEVDVEEIWPSFRPNGAKNIFSFTRKISRAIKNKEQSLVYAYWIEPDHTIHMDGVSGKKTKRVIRRIDFFLRNLTRHNKDTLFVLMADHGLTDVHFFDIQEHEDFFSTLKRPFALEPRTATFFVKDHHEEEFVRLFKKYYGQYFLLKSKSEVLQENIFGPKPMKKDIQDFLGEYVALATDKYGFYYSSLKEKPFMKAHHAGLLSEEMDINLTLVNK
jgi:hypothetical protein